MSLVDVKVEGEERIKAALDSLVENLDEETVKALNEAADLIVRDAKDFCPVDTGSLRQSIRREVVVKEGETTNVRVRAGGYVTNPKSGRLVDYASHVEFGTKNMEPRAFLRPAIRMNEGKLKDIMSKAMRNAKEESKQ